jgi:hypothetical protein
MFIFISNRCLEINSLRTPNSELRIPNSEFRTPNSELNPQIAPMPSHLYPEELKN